MSDSFDPQPIAKPASPAKAPEFNPQPVKESGAKTQVNLAGATTPPPTTLPRIETKPTPQSDFDPQPVQHTSFVERAKENVSEGFDQTLVGQAKKNYESGVTLSKAADSVEEALKTAKAKGQQTVYLPSGGDAKVGRMLGTAQALPLDEGYRQLALMRAEADSLKAEYSLSSQLAKEKLEHIQPWARDSHPLLSGMTALAGQVVGGLGSPENFLGTAPERLAATFLRDIGKSALRGALEMAPIGAAQSAFRQTSEKARGERSEVSLGEIGEDTLFASAFGAGVGGASRGLGRLLGDFKEAGAEGSFGSRLDLGDTSTWEKPNFRTQESTGRANRVEPQLFPEPTFGEKTTEKREVKAEDKTSGTSSTAAAKDTTPPIVDKPSLPEEKPTLPPALPPTELPESKENVKSAGTFTTVNGKKFTITEDGNAIFNGDTSWLRTVYVPSEFIDHLYAPIGKEAVFFNKNGLIQIVRQLPTPFGTKEEGKWVPNYEGGLQTFKTHPEPGLYPLQLKNNRNLSVLTNQITLSEDAGDAYFFWQKHPKIKDVSIEPKTDETNSLKIGRPEISLNEFVDQLPARQKELLVRDPEHYGEMHAEDPERFPLPEEAFKERGSEGVEGASRREDGGLRGGRPTLPDDARLTVFDHAEPADREGTLDAARAPGSAANPTPGSPPRPAKISAPYQAHYSTPFKPQMWKDWLLNTISPTSRKVEGSISVGQGKGKTRLDTGVNPTRAAENAIISHNAALAADWSRIHQAFKTPITITSPSGRTFKTTLAGLSASAPEADQLAVIRALDDIKNGNANHPVPNGPMREVFNVLRGMIDTARDLLKSIGKLQDAEHANSFRIWQSSVDPNFKQSMREGTLRGGGGFLKERTRETIDDGFDAGDKLITTDPIELNKIRLFSMMQYYHGEMLRREMVGTKIARFYRGYARPGANTGLVRLDDPAFDSYRYIEEVQHLVTHETSVDPQVEAALKKVTDLLGVEQKTPLRGEDDYLAGRIKGQEKRGKASRGYTYRTPGKPVVAVFGSAQQVMEHEIGHQIDNIHPDLRASILSNDIATQELKDLSLLRRETAMKAGLVPQSYINGYLQTNPEMMANLFHAYWYAPQVLEKTAPTVLKILENWLDKKGELGEAIRNVEPSLEIASRTRTEKVKGEPGHTKYEGSYYAPEPIARLFNNFMSQGLSRFDLVRGMKNINNAVNRIHFSASLFHFFVISNDAVISNTARGLEQLSRGEFSQGLKTSAASLPILNLLDIKRTYGRGQAARRTVAQEMLGTSTSPISRLVIESGMRIEQMYWNKALDSENFWQIIKGGKFKHELLKDVSAKISGWGKAGQLVKNAAELAYKAVEFLPEQIMSEYVPSMKIGIMLNMADDIMRREPGMSLPVLRDRMERLSQSLDNRMGQVVYDNLFWHKGIKDVGFLATQSLGWTLGTIREIGGGGVDVPTYLNQVLKSGGKETAITHRMAYTLALPITMGLYGMMTQLVMTTFFAGKPSPPTSWRDFFFPRTGRILPGGVPERISIPSYIKDVFQWFHAPVQTIAGKESALVQNAQQLWNWADYRGIPITDPMHSAPQQMWEFLGFATGQVLPFSFTPGKSKSTKELNKDPAQKTYSTFMSIMGMNPAPSWLVDEDKDRMMTLKHYQREHRDYLRAHRED